MANSQFELTGGTHLAQIAAELKAIGEVELRKRLTRELRRAAAPLVPKVRQSILAIPVKGPKSTGLRQQMAKATTLQLRTSGSQAGFVIRVDGRKMPTSKRTLPSYMEGRKRPWRHPVFGGDTWATQQPHPYFYRVVDPVTAEVRLRMNAIAHEIVDQIH